MTAPLSPSRRFSWWGAVSLFAFSTTFAAFGATTAVGNLAFDVAQTPPRALLVGGGPNPGANPIAIESNLRYLHRLLGIKASRAGTTTLFADGSTKTATVLYQVPYPSQGEELVSTLTRTSPAATAGQQWRTSQLSSCDGAATKPQISQAVQVFAQAPDKSPFLMYFTGHGSPNRADLENNFYMLWGDDKLTVRDLAQEMKTLPPAQRVALVMVQCFSGSFANLLFEDGDPKGEMIPRDFAGYFATTKERVAAGCTPEVNEAEYRDFTSYFFAALSGRDRVGRKVGGSDYNKDGQVGMDEAYAYSLIHDESIDVPVRTLDAFVRRFSTLSEAQIFATPYSQIQKWADPGQRAALNALSDYVKLSGEDRVSKAWDNLQHGKVEVPPQAGIVDDKAVQDMFVNGSTRLITQFPDLRSRDDATRQRAVGEATQWLNTALDSERKAAQNPPDPANPAVWTPLLTALHQIQSGQYASELHSIAESHVLRFVRLGKTIVLEHDLAANGTPEIQDRMARLLVAERRALPLKSNF